MEIYFFPSIKFNEFIFIVGILLMMIGHIFRIGAMFTAKQNFTHLIACRKKETHKLVTNGLYR